MFGFYLDKNLKRKSIEGTLKAQNCRCTEIRGEKIRGLQTVGSE